MSIRKSGENSGGVRAWKWAAAAIIVPALAGGALAFSLSGHAAPEVNTSATDAMDSVGSPDNMAGASTELAKRVAKAHNGAVIALPPGDYGEAAFHNLRTGGMVTLTSADRAHPAVFAALSIRNSNGVRFDGIKVDASKSSLKFPITILNSDHIELKGIDAIGGGYGASPAAISALMIRDSGDVTVEKSRFRLFWHGISLLGSTRLRVAANELRDLRTDGIRGGGLIDTVIEDNFITDFHPMEGDHPDGIQIWSVRQKTGSRNLTIQNNLVARGKGDAAQGIFVNEQTGTLPYQNLVIRGNFIVGGRFNGVSVQHAEGLTIEDNAIVGLPDRLSWLRVLDSSGGMVTRNSAMKFNFSRKNSGITFSNNDITGAASLERAQARMMQWLSGKPRSRAATGPLLSPPLAADKIGPTVTSGENPDQRERMQRQGGPRRWQGNRLAEGGAGDERPAREHRGRKAAQQEW